MSQKTPRHLGQPEPLPDEFDLELRELDLRLRDVLGQITPPPGLADRVFEASVRLLPKPELQATSIWPRLRLVGGSRHALRWQTWGRVAMAASVALAACAAVWMAQPRAIDQHGGGELFARGPVIVPAHLQVLTDWPTGSSGDWENKTAVYRETAEATAYDIAYEIAWLGREAGM